MSAALDGALAAALQADLACHAGFGSKRSGGAGDAATAAWIAQRLAGLGFEVAHEPVDVPWFEAEACSLRAGDDEAAVHAQAPVVCTPAQGITAPLAVVRAPWEAQDARGRIALLVLPHGRHAAIAAAAVRPLVDAALAAGAHALVIVPTGPTGEIVAFNAPRAASGTDVPTAVLAPRAAEPFLRAARRGLPATLRLSGRLEARRTTNLHARLARGRRWLCLSTPRTGWFTCAAERGGGTAALLALARWAADRFAQHSIYVLNTGAHEYLFAGAHQALAGAPAPGETTLWAHLGAGLAARERLEFRTVEAMLDAADAQRFTMATPPLQAAAAQAFAGLPGLARVVPPLEGVSELGAIAARGYGRAFAALGVPRAFHTPLDTLDQVSGALLAPVVAAHQAVIDAAVAQEAAAA